MKIRRVTIRNFKILQDVDISFDGGLTFLNANNGCGKTTFQEAIKWCLYGPNALNLNEPLASSLAAGSSSEVEVSVKLMVEDYERDENIEITRTVIWNTVGNRAADHEVGANLQIRIDGLEKPKSAEVLQNPKVWIEANFPVSFLSYFLFDGEIMYKFFEDEVKAEVGSAIKSIARVEAVDALEEYFSKAAKKFRLAAAKEAGPDVIELNKTREAARDELHRLQTIEEPEAKARVTQWEKSKSGAARVLSRLKDAQELLRSIDEFDREGGSLNQAEQNIERLNNEFVETFLARPFLAFQPSFLSVPELVQKAKREGWYPLPFSVAALQELIEVGRCICGNHLQAGSEAERSIQRIITDRKEMGEKGVELGDLAAGVQTIEGQISEVTASIHSKNQEIANAKRQYVLLQESYQAKRLELGNLSLPDAKAAQTEYEASIVGLASASKDLKDLEERIQFQIGNVEKAEEALKQAQGQSEEQVRMEGFATRAEELAAASRHLASMAVEDVKLRIKEAMDSAFSYIGEGEFHSEISADFELDTLDASGKPAGLSEGQKMMRAYIFSIVLREVVGYQFPLLVDTPLGRLDTTNSRETANLLSEFVSSASRKDGVQIIMSMHDGEYTPYVKQHFAPVQPQELYFTYEIPAKKSVVGEGIDPTWWREPGAWRDWHDGKVAQH